MKSEQANPAPCSISLSVRDKKEGLSLNQFKEKLLLTAKIAGEGNHSEIFNE